MNTEPKHRYSSPSPRAEPAQAEADEPLTLRPARILAVDDNPGDLLLLTRELEVDGHTVIPVRTGEQALELLASTEVDCILLDLGLPGMSGGDVCRRIKTSELRDLPVIVLTGADADGALADSIDRGADDYVSKAQEPVVLRSRVRAQLRRKHYEEENRRVHEAVLRREAEVLAAQAVADTRAQLVAELKQRNAELEDKNTELDRLNRELETFAYSVSHDLRQPLRAIEGFAQVLRGKIEATLDPKSRHCFDRIEANVARMEELIDGLLALSRVNRADLCRQPVDLEVLCREVVDRLLAADPERQVTVEIEPNLVAMADRRLVCSVMENLLGNAWKFTRTTPDAIIRVGRQAQTEVLTYSVADNGVGFDMAYADKLFAPFQRLHRQQDFEGTGVGLATVQRIVHRHRGEIWGQSTPGAGTTFFFTLGEEPRTDVHHDPD